MQTTNIKFVAFDVETATASSPRHICQIALVAVNDKYEIEEKIAMYIQPPNNKIDVINRRVHGITPEITEKAKPFNEVWHEISEWFKYPLVAHNASFDIGVLKENLEYHNLQHLPCYDYTCTYYLWNCRSLKELCAGFDIALSNHHDAGFDAECCAKFLINHFEKIKPDEARMDEVKKNKRKRKPSPKHTKINKSDYIESYSEEVDESNPFFKKHIIVTGVFNLERVDILKKISMLGGQIKSSFSAKTNYIIVGNEPGPSKMKSAEKLIEKGTLSVMYESELNEILDYYLPD